MSSPSNLLVSTPPNVSSPLASLSEVVGAKEIPTSFVSSRPRENALSVTVGTELPSEVVPDKEMVTFLDECILYR